VIVVVVHAEEVSRGSRIREGALDVFDEGVGQASGEETAVKYRGGHPRTVQSVWTRSGPLIKRRYARILFGALCALALTFGVVGASAAASRTFVNDFEKAGDETPANSWYPNPPATNVRTPSGAAATYASGIQSSHGKWHVRMSPNDVCPKQQASVACSGSFTFWGKADTTNAVLPDGGYVTQIDVYLDVPWMTQDPTTRYDTRFEWDSAINDQFGGFRRDFVFNAGTPLTPGETASSPGYYVNASTNAFRPNAYPQNPCPSPSDAPNYCRTPVKITPSGWYTFRHFFHLVNIGGTSYLAVDMTILRGNAVVKTWTIYDKEDAAGFGGDAYGWFVINEITDLAADCVALHPPGMLRSTRPGSPCRFVREKGENPCERTAATDQAELEELDRINRERAALLLPPLTLNTASSNAARKHSCDDRERGDDGEQGSDGSSPSDRLHAEGVSFLVNAETLGLADGATASDALATIHSDLLDEVTSQANILNPAFKEVGIGVVYLDGVMWLTEDFTG
jgi:uncharacterized protein YkwD